MIVEDQVSVAMEIEEMLTENGYQVLGVVDSGEKALSMATQNHPDLVLMDIKLSGNLDGIDTAIQLRAKRHIPSLFLTGHAKEELVNRAIKADPLGYIIKPLNPVQILTAVKVALGKIALEKETHPNSECRHIPDALMGLTAKELAIADIIRDGKNNSEIASELGIATQTVKWHRKQIRKVIGINNTTVDLMVALRVLY